MAEFPKNIKANLESIRPVRDLISFFWIKPKFFKGLMVPENYGRLGPEAGHGDGLRLGRFYYGRIHAVGPKVKLLKPGEIILVHEYGIINYEGEWEESHLYFIEEKYIKAIVKDYNEKEGYFPIERKITKGMLEKYKADQIPIQEAKAQVKTRG